MEKQLTLRIITPHGQYEKSITESQAAEAGTSFHQAREAFEQIIKYASCTDIETFSFTFEYTISPGVSGELFMTAQQLQRSDLQLITSTVGV